ncbi:MAG: hypothetical protein Kow0069_03760 [Promethearchaeota archaeon]
MQVNAWPWLAGLKAAGRAETLGDVPSRELDELCSHFDAVWLMGVWERSPRSREVARDHPGLRREYEAALPDFRPSDVVGSPFAVHRYVVDDFFGGDGALAQFRQDLADRGARLLLDFVPNHLAVDHPWTREYPECFVGGTRRHLEDRPGEFFVAGGGHVLAHGRDPNFPPWTDTAQVNAQSVELRLLYRGVLERLARACDGARCDMAMLVARDVFERTWGWTGCTRGDGTTRAEFWEEILPAARDVNPQFIFVAEVYWDMEWALLQQGFDFCYDKRLYDRLLRGTAVDVRGHLGADWEYSRRLVRFVENHDEQRSVTALGWPKARAAAALALTLPGARLVQEGQALGWQVRLPVQLGRRPVESADPEVASFYSRLLPALPGGFDHSGRWVPCDVESVGGGDGSHVHVVAGAWETPPSPERTISVVNYSPWRARAHVRVPRLQYAAEGRQRWSFHDALAGRAYEYVSADLDRHGLYVELPPWGAHLFRVAPAR